ncbi:MAG TPA: hypothetical protein VJS37_06605, partial [Terriglobales bacterium]|nr:hypothetical protein [Terriglobales bacterium]
MVAARATSLLKIGTRVCLLGGLAIGMLVLCFSNHAKAGSETASGLIAHEWGTFTAVAGADGRALHWIPLVNPAELPGFVQHLSSPVFKFGLRGTIRMETPVLYFYSPREQTLSVKVAFAKGLITEWYPHAARVQPAAVEANTDLDQLRSAGSITWSNVVVSPGLEVEFPRDSGQTRYYAARETSSAPLRVK